jgi:nucleolar complex protein 2
MTRSKHGRFLPSSPRILAAARFSMGKKATKSTRKFAASGQLQKTIQTRRKHQEIRRKTQSKQKRKDARPKHSAGAEDAEEADSAEESAPRKNKPKYVCSTLSSHGSYSCTRALYRVKSVDDFLSGAFMDDDASDVRLVYSS